MAVCNITPIRKITESEEMDSVLYGELKKVFNLATVRNIYDNLHSSSFIEWFGADWTTTQGLKNTYKTGEPKLIDGAFINLKGERLEVSTVKEKVDKDILFGNTLKTLLDNQKIDKKVNLNSSMAAPIAASLDKNTIYLSREFIQSSSIPLSFARSLLLSLYKDNSNKANNALNNLRALVSQNNFKRIEELKETYSSDESVDQAILESFKSKQSNEIEQAKNVVIRSISNELGIEGNKVKNLLLSMIYFPFNKETDIEVGKQDLSSLSEITDIKNKELSFDFDEGLIDIEKERISKGYSREQVYQELAEKPDYTILESLIRGASTTSLGADLINFINSKKVNKNNITIITSLPLVSAVANRLGLPLEAITSTKNEEVIKENKLNEDTTLENASTGDSTTVLESQANKNKRNIVANSLQGVTHITTDALNSVDNSISYRVSTDLEKTRDRLGEEGYSKLLNVVEKEKIALEERLAYYKNRSKITNSTPKAIKELQDTIKQLEEKETYEQFVILLKKARKDLTKLENFLKNDKNFKTYSPNTLFSLSFMDTFIDSYELLNDPTFSKNNEELKTEILELGTSIAYIKDNHPERTRETVAFLFSRVSEEPKYKNNKEELLEILQGGEDLGYIGSNARSLGMSGDTILSLFFKQYEAKVTEVSVESNKISREILKEDKLLKEAGYSNQDWMIDKENATFVDKTSDRFLNFLEKSREKVKGLKFKEVPVNTLNITSQEVIDYNIKLAEDRAEANEATRVETYNKDLNTFFDGENQKYTDKFKKERDKFEVYNTTTREWEKNPAVSESDYFNYMQKNYKEPFFTLKALKRDKKYTGETELVSYRLPKQSNIEVTPKWHSSEYNSIVKNPAKLRYYNFIMGVMEKNLNYLPSNFETSMYKRLPAMKKHLVDSFKDSPHKLKVVSENFKKALIPEALLSNSATDENGNRREGVPILYVGQLRDDKKVIEYQEKRDKQDKNSPEYIEYDRKYKIEKNKTPVEEVENNITDSVMAFSQTVANYKIMTEFEPTVNAVKTVLDNKDYYKTQAGNLIPEGNSFKKIDEKQSNTQRQFEQFLSNVFYESNELNDGIVAVGVKKLMNASSIVNLGANVTSSAVNVVMAKYALLQEAVGGQFFNYKELRKGTSEVSKSLLSYDRLEGKTKGDLKPRTKVDAMMLDWRLLQDTKEAGDFKSTSSKTKKVLDLKWLFFLQDTGEYKVQADLATTMLMAEKIKLKDGSEISVYDAHELRDGKFLLKKKIEEQGVFNSKDRDRVAVKALTLNKQLYGLYTKQDKASFQSHWIGQLAFQHKRWATTAFDSRFRKKIFNEGLTDYTEGRYITFGKFIKDNYLSQAEEEGLMFHQLSFSQHITSLLNVKRYFTTYKKLGRVEKANMKKNGIEALSMLVAFASVTALSSIAGGLKEDDVLKKKCLNFLISVGKRSENELWTFLSASTIIDTVKNPFAAIRLLESGEEILAAGLGELYLPEKDLIYQKGVYKGRRKSIKELLDVFPILKLINLRDRLNKEENYDKSF